ncbi:outer membrane lipid asymmetry maintenance protein MlaD [Kiloniella antarctica]|jgi:phospholipid/cholesterol/gamma-HCH transport system substrate-binding protein|uniref:Outer membrane lipid asymmetry maintenance protein MlaD n=1 Tax=Kiloniella antarctica TaxID=1550907 RepID=A0ABW5BMT2_9PROT
MNRSIVETIIGGLVLLVAVSFGFYAFSNNSTGSTGGYEIVAEFDNASGLVSGTDVKIAGVKVGTVLRQELDNDTYFAVVTLQIKDEIKLPKGTSARILAESLLGGSFVSLEPGGDDEFIEAGGSLENTQGAVNLMDLLGRFVFSSVDSD